MTEDEDVPDAWETPVTPIEMVTIPKSRLDALDASLQSSRDANLLLNRNVAMSADIIQRLMDANDKRLSALRAAATLAISVLGRPMSSTYVDTQKARLALEAALNNEV